jgi:hypothetical protein
MGGRGLSGLRARIRWDCEVMQGGNDSDSSNGEGSTPSSAALYIASLSGELAKLAKRHGLDALSFILEMARLEADQDSKG